MKRFLKYLVGFIKYPFIPKITPKKFSDAVHQYFNFLASEYDYFIQPQAPDHFIAEKDDIRLHLALERGINPVVYVEFLGQAAQQVGKTNCIDVLRIVGCLYPEVETEMKFIEKRTDIDGMRKKLEKYATLTKNYGAQILAGDLSRWPEVDACLDEWERKFRERHGKITKK